MLFCGLDYHLAAFQIDRRARRRIADRKLRTLAHLDQRSVTQFHHRAGILGRADALAAQQLFARLDGLGLVAGDFVDPALRRLDDRAERVERIDRALNPWPRE